MGQQQGRACGSRRGEYASLSSIEIERLASERGLGRRRRSGLLEADRATLIALLKAYDAGATASNGKALAGGRCGGGTDCKDGSGYWYEGPPSLDVIADWCRSDLEVVAQILDAPAYKGVDIGGTLWKLVMALPEDVEAEHRYPKEFGTTGRTRPDLDFACEWEGQRHVLRFVSGATSQIEACVRHFGNEFLDLDQPSSQDGECDETSTRASSSQDPKDVHSPGRSELAFSRCSSSNSIASMCNWTPRVQKVFAAGGGAHKFAQLFHDTLQMEMVAVKELTAVVDGLIFLMLHGPRSGNLFVANDDDAVPLPWPEPLFPFIVVNIGSGVSILRVDSASEYVRVGGTACGGGTFLGLARALTSAETFEEALQLAEGGDASRCDLLVSDIYGNDGSASLGLAGNLTAANFGRLCSDAPDDEEDCTGVCSEQDLARSLLQMVTQQSVLLSSAFARQYGCIDRVFFVGGFIEEGNHLARKTIADNFRRLDGRAYFLRHCDFLGALGSLWAGLGDAGVSLVEASQ